MANEMDRNYRLEYVKEAAGHIGADDTEIFEAFDAAECALENDADDAAEKFVEFCELLDARGIVVTESRPAYTAQEERWIKTPRSNRGRVYGSR
jgi:hypothetical protein